MKSTKKASKGVSLATVKALWQKYNEIIFEGQLHLPVIRITRSTKYYGRCDVTDSRPGKIALFISGWYCRNEPTSLDDTLVHEMVHQWQYENGMRFNDNHDETFTKWIPVIQEKAGITLQESWKDS